ncbi:MAG: hypothetical protein K2I05_04725 [Mailhella sp.]|nr:hypothetical protein [Mailhella sp.]
MKKSTLFTFMIGLIILVGLGSFVAGKNNAAAEKGMPEPAKAAEDIGYAEYAGIYMLKELLPYAAYKENVLPHAQKLFAKKKITRKDFSEFQENVEKSLNSKGYSVKEALIAHAKEESFSDSFQRNIEKFNEDAEKMGQEMKQGIENFMKGLMDENGGKSKTQQPKGTEL